jgi:hypothetical protein
MTSLGAASRICDNDLLARPLSDFDRRIAGAPPTQLLQPLPERVVGSN